MANSMYGSICIEDLFAGKIATSQDGRQWLCITDLQTGPFQVGKNGKHYANIGLWINDQPDNYGNHGSLSLSQTKDERAANAKRVYVGNMKWSGQQQAAAQPAQGYPQQYPQQAPAGYPQQAPAGYPQQAPAGYPPTQAAAYPPAAAPSYPPAPAAQQYPAAPAYPQQAPQQNTPAAPAYSQPKAPVNGDLPF